jgi:two-component system, OmpR family, response regulator QseB
MNILLVEDDLDLGESARIALADEGFRVQWLRRRTDALLSLQRWPVDVVLLDLGLPDGDGIELLTRIRREHGAPPVIVITARDALADRLKGLDSGADDYLVKPFALAELLSRIRALARRCYGGDGDVLQLRGLTVHLATRRVLVDGGVVELSRSEFDLLAAMVKRADRVLARSMLEEQVLPSGGHAESNVLDVQISKLRRKIGEGYIRTVRGVGYVIDRAALSKRAKPIDCDRCAG